MAKKRERQADSDWREEFWDKYNLAPMPSNSWINRTNIETFERDIRLNKREVEYWQEQIEKSFTELYSHIKAIAHKEPDRAQQMKEIASWIKDICIPRRLHHELRSTAPYTAHGKRDLEKKQRALKKNNAERQEQIKGALPLERGVFTI